MTYQQFLLWKQDHLRNQHLLTQADMDILMSRGGEFELETQTMNREGWEHAPAEDWSGNHYEAVDENGRLYPDVHWACDLSGEDQPPFKGWFRPVCHINGEFSRYVQVHIVAIRKPNENQLTLELG